MFLIISILIVGISSDTATLRIINSKRGERNTGEETLSLREEESGRRERKRREEKRNRVIIHCITWTRLKAMVPGVVRPVQEIDTIFSKASG